MNRRSFLSVLSAAAVAPAPAKLSRPVPFPVHGYYCTNPFNGDKAIESARFAVNWDLKKAVLALRP